MIMTTVYEAQIDKERELVCVRHFNEQMLFDLSNFSTSFLKLMTLTFVRFSVSLSSISTVVGGRACVVHFSGSHAICLFLFSLLYLIVFIHLIFLSISNIAS